MEIRQIFAARLKAEMDRHLMGAENLAIAANLDVKVVGDYLKATRELKFREIGLIGNALGFDMFTFLSPDYAPSRLMFRSCKKSAKDAIQNIEKILQIIKFLLPEPLEVNISRTIEFNDRSIMSAMVSRAVQEVKEKFGENVESVYSHINLPVLPVSVPEEFEAFLFSSGGKYVVCINMHNKAYSRAMFSLLHELSHYIFDRNSLVDVDVRASMYSKNVVRGHEPEFYATKFAQYFLVPIEKACRWATLWPNVDIDDICGVIRSSHCSKDVVTNAIYDCLEMKNIKEQYVVIKNFIDSGVRQEFSNDILRFLKQRQHEFLAVVEDNSALFSDEVYNRIITTLNSWR